MKSENKIIADKFKVILDRLTKKGVRAKIIADSVGVDPQKIYNIKKGRSSANKEMLNKLLSAYPEFSASDVLKPKDGEVISIIVGDKVFDIKVDESGEDSGIEITRSGGGNDPRINIFVHHYNKISIT